VQRAGKSAEGRLNTGNQMTQIADIGGAGGGNAAVDAVSAPECDGILFHYAAERLVLPQRKVTGYGGDFGFCADRHGSAVDGAIHNLARVGDGIRVCAADVGFNPHMIRYAVDNRATVGDDRMDADVILVPEDFAVGVDPHEPEHCGVESVDSLKGLAAVCRSAVKIDGFGCKAETFPVQIQRRAGRIGMRVQHHRQIDPVKRALQNHLLLAAEVFDFALLTQLHAVFHVQKFLCRCCEQCDAAVKLLHHT